MAEHDLVIRDGTVVDGTGRDRFDGDLYGIDTTTLPVAAPAA